MGVLKMRAQNIGNQVPAANDIMADVAKPVTKPFKEPQEQGATTLGFWVGLAILYILWDYVVLRNTKIKEIVNPGNIRANLYNIVLIGMSAVIFINGFKVFLVKVAAWELPGVSWLAKKLLPLFQL